MNGETLRELAERVESVSGPALFDFLGNPSWAQEGGEHFDGGWTPDCNGKGDFDPGLLRLSCRVYPDGDYICSVILGEDAEIETTGIQRAASKTEAKAAVEQWAGLTAARYRDLLAAALRARSTPDPRPEGEGEGE